MWSIPFYVAQSFRFIAASTALSGYTVKCVTNKMHKAETGKSMSLLTTLRILHEVRRVGHPLERRQAPPGTATGGLSPRAPGPVPFALEQVPGPMCSRALMAFQGSCGYQERREKDRARCQHCVTETLVSSSIQGG